MKIQKRCERGGAAFSNYPTRAVGHEAINHHPIILRDTPNARCCHLAQCIQRHCGPEAFDHELYGSKRIGDETVVGFTGFEFNDEIAVDAVRASVEWAISNDTQNRIEQVTRFDEVGFFAQRMKPKRLVAREQRIDRAIKQHVDRPAQQSGGIASCLKNTQCFALKDEHRTMRQDCAGDMDRFAIAIGQIDPVAFEDRVIHKLHPIHRAIARISQRSGLRLRRPPRVRVPRLGLPTIVQDIRAKRRRLPNHVQ